MPSSSSDHHHPAISKAGGGGGGGGEGEGNRRPPAPDPNPDPDPDSATANTGGYPMPPPATNRGVQYRECQKNHAASMGGHVVDGCGEFMPGGDEGTLDALKCAACDCHRNFHRKEIDGQSPAAWLLAPGRNNSYHNNSNNPNGNSGNRRTAPMILPPPQPIFQHRHYKYPHGSPVGPIPPVMVAFGGGTATESSSEDPGALRSNAMAAAPVPAQPASSKKRFRTKFSLEQKERMMEFAEKMEWKIQKGDEEKVQEFCTEVGVKRHVFKVWMHNNKQATKKKES